MSQNAIVENGMTKFGATKLIMSAKTAKGITFAKFVRPKMLNGAKKKPTIISRTPNLLALSGKSVLVIA